MVNYRVITVVLRFSVVLLLLIGAQRICFYSGRWYRLLIGAALGGIYAGSCFAQQLYFLGNDLWHLVFLLLIASIAYGWNRESLRAGIIFVLLNMVLDSIVSGVDLFQSILGLIGLMLFCILGFYPGSRKLIPVRLSYDRRKIYIKALYDTGNTLIDPVTGRPALVVGAQVANNLVGLTQEQLKNPVENVGCLPGLRLIPYSTIGQSGTMMLGMFLKDVEIGQWRGSGLVAFAPECLGSADTYQALTGGKL